MALIDARQPGVSISREAIKFAIGEGGIRQLPYLLIDGPSPFDSVDAKEYARGDVTTNTIESYFSVFKRGMRRTYQHCSEKHLHRYLAEFDFRYSNRVKLGVDDGERTARAIKGIIGKRLTYQTTRN